MIDVSDIQEKLSAVAAGEMAVWEFRDWIREASWNMHIGSSEEAMNLVGEIESLLGEREDGTINDAGLRTKLSALRGPVYDSMPSYFEATPLNWIAWTSGGAEPEAVALQLV